MKTCTYCGRKYSDDTTVCPVDGEPVVNPEEKARQSKSAQNAFNVKIISPFSSIGTYRVFVERSDLIFVQMEGGARSVLDILAPFLGPFGGLIPLFTWLFRQRKSGLKRQRVEEGNPEDLLRESEKNFKLNVAEIRDATIGASTGLAVSGKAGRLNLVVRHGEKMKCEFANTDGMKKAIQLLVPFLGSMLKVNVEWNEQKHQFQKLKTV